MRRAVVLACLTLGADLLHAGEQPIAVEVDLSRAPLRVFHARLSIPARPGPLTLLYPKWLPGEHGPTGPIADLAGLEVSAGGIPVAWRRDPTDLYAFHVEVPAGANVLEVELDFLSPASSEGFTSGASASAKLAVLSWNQVVLYPEDGHAGELVYAARLRLPAGWGFGTALPLQARSGAELVFDPVTLVTLVDSPVLAGEYMRDVGLTPPGGVPHLMHVAADSRAALEFEPGLEAAYAKLVAEALALFGGHPYRRYDFLVTLSDQTARFGLEHHESSDNRSWERALVDPDRRRLMAGLLPHELVHAWNGKYRRPATLTNDDFARPIDSSLLWVYEGLTTYLGDVLTARSGLWSAEEYRDNLALDAAAMERRTGRRWRPLADTAVAAQILFGSRADGANWRRDVDFYAEGALIWLEADVLIRQATAGRRSLDDFCRSFFHGKSGPPEVRPYVLSDVIAALDGVARHDWAGFFAGRLDHPVAAAPLGGIAAAGWRLDYDTTPSPLLESTATVRKTTDASHSIGLVLDENGRVVDNVPGLPAERAGVGPGMRVVAVNGRKYSSKVLRSAIRATAAGQPLELLVENAEYFATHALDYSGGDRFARLVRDEARPDLLSRIIAPRSGS